MTKKNLFNFSLFYRFEENAPGSEAGFTTKPIKNHFPSHVYIVLKYKFTVRLPQNYKVKKKSKKKIFFLHLGGI